MEHGEDNDSKLMSAVGSVEGEHDRTEDSDWDSLFDEAIDGRTVSDSGITTSSRAVRVSQAKSSTTMADRVPASRSAPPIPGLHFDPAICLPDELATNLVQKCMETYFQEEDVNQIMLFERARDPFAQDTPHNVSSDSLSNGLPEFLQDTLKSLALLLKGHLPANTYDLLFPLPSASSLARQVILNLYRAGEGISAHVDLLRRFGDGIVGLSLQSGCVMRFEQARQEESDDGVEPHEGRLMGGGESHNVSTEISAHSLYLPASTVIVLTGDARYLWTHAIEPLTGDSVQSASKLFGGDIRETEWISRGTRLSITFRWLLPGADVVGELD